MAGSVVKSLCSIVTLIIVVVIVVIVLRTLTLDQRTIQAPECKPMDTDFIHGDKSLLSRFQAALRFETISTARYEYNAEQLDKIRKFITLSYPSIHTSPLVTLEIIAKYSMLYTVEGSNKSLTPYMLTGHLDVVPVPENNWEAPPFSGEILNGFIYGRGTIDDKHIVFGILEALEFLLRSGHKPQRTFYLGFGHDEEAGGPEGAYTIGQTLMARGVHVEFLLDEGMPILDGTIPGISNPVALVGSSEKGSLTIRLSVTTKGGHSSMPRKESSIGILANAIAKLEDNPHPSMFGTGPERSTFEHLAYRMNLPFRVIMSNLWLFSPLVARFMSRKPETNTVVRTTTAVTMFKAGVKENVIAPYAEAVVNHRIHPMQSVQEVLDYDKQLINDDRIKYSIIDSMEPLPISPSGDEDFGWQSIKTSIRQVWAHAGVVVAPSVMTGNTDTRHYTNITNNLYRFSPTYMYPEDLPRFHGLNERISVKNYEEAVNFFYHLMINADKVQLDSMHTHGEEL